MKAFPQSAKTMYGDENCEWGMDLRDYFAAKAMSAFLNGCSDIEDNYEEEGIAIMSYKMADAMMEARNDS
jgi:hypothetical protein